MRTRRTWLVATNMTLALGVAVAVWAVPARGVQRGVRPPGQYTMVAGEVRGGGDASGIYIVDSVNQEVVALRWNESRQQFDGLDYRSLELDAGRGGER